MWEYIFGEKGECQERLVDVDVHTQKNACPGCV
jgi:hypothetical protein